MPSVLSHVSESDLRLSGRLLEWTPPRWFRRWMLWATRLGDGWIWLAAGVVLAAGDSFPSGHALNVLAGAALGALIGGSVFLALLG